MFWIWLQVDWSISGGEITSPIVALFCVCVCVLKPLIPYRLCLVLFFFFYSFGNSNSNKTCTTTTHNFCHSVSELVSLCTHNAKSAGCSSSTTSETEVEKTGPFILYRELFIAEMFCVCVVKDGIKMDNSAKSKCFKSLDNRQCLFVTSFFYVRFIFRHWNTFCLFYERKNRKK